ncbi:MAG: bifunctional D-glycero-beta-D-manno-heptose-7-phosphate kinase/D-glycero-beta-D-manno-heptose 1-phosphate adenylyltransferase HldE [Sphingomonadaceae bacterium]|nr:bifunctional D-glycero-beta-D-manno-heptose-7-phosphate kinase/D-glycero-beta-D-manno-heptose 1-phosphate adenylyltransferase HldE [Sphingomonadaceae bacterium]
MKNFEIFKKEKKILVVGDVMLDRYYEGRVDRISPEAPVPILKVLNDFDRPGGAANVAINIAKLGLQVTLVGYVGNDPAADALASAVEHAGVAFKCVRSFSCPTILKLRALSQKQQIIRIDFEESFADEDHNHMVVELKEMISEFDAVVLSDYAKGTLHNASEIIDLCLNSGKPVFVDPKGNDFLRYAGATMITPNLLEFTNVTGCYVDNEQFARAAHNLRRELRLKHILVTRGENGMGLFSDSGVDCHIDADAREVYDVTGAGDTVIATIAAAFASGLPMEQAVRLSNIAAGLVVARTGTSAVTAEEVIARLQDLAEHKTTEPIVAIKAAKGAGHKIVMTNGCFDILHSGHVSYLEQAKGLGDKLVVGINSDASITRLKGKGRPINTLKDRMALLSALRCVDWVVPFDGSVDQDGTLQDTPLTLIKSIEPDILVKGGDYSINSIVGASDVIQRGGRVEIIPLVEGRSTTAIVNRLADASLVDGI